MRTAPDPLISIRPMTLLYRAAQRLDRTSGTLKRDLEAHGFPVTGDGRGRRCYLADLTALLAMEEEAARSKQNGPTLAMLKEKAARERRKQLEIAARGRAVQAKQAAKRKAKRGAS